MQKNNYQTFEEEYEKLNEKQKEAVDTIYGPVLVVAGPGTGKTQILALRIANLLLSDAQIAPQNILCLTFTEEGKKNMRERLFKLVGAETAQSIAVHTYHSFCNEVIQQNISLFNKDILEPVSDLEKIQFVKQICMNIGKDSVLYNAKNPNANAKYLLGMFSKMKQENWTAEYLLQKTNEQIAFMETDEQFKSTRGPSKGEITKAFQSEIEAYKKSIGAIKLFDDYKNMMFENHRYDFDDMINWVIEMFETNPDVLMGYFERYQYLLVDEFQDTNGAQMKIVSLLSSYDDTPNTFVVGDDDQSIYRFQGASVDNMIHFKDKYLAFDLKQICLKINYRSTQGILDTAKNLIENAGNRLVNTNPDLDKNLVSFNTENTGIDFSPVLISALNPRYEKIFIAKKVKALLETGVKPNEIAILFNENKHCVEMGAYLEKLDIPFYTKKNMNLFEDKLAIQLLNILKYIALERSNPYSGDGILFEILHYRFFNIPAIEIAKSSILSYQKSSENRKNKYSFRRYLQENISIQNPTLFIENGKDAFQYAVTTLEELIKDSFNLSLVQLMDEILKKCYVIKTILISENKFEDLETLTALFDFIKDEAHRDTTLDVNNLVNLLDIMEENGIQLPLVKLYGNENSVRIFTTHSAKGREFEYVFLAGIVKSQYEKKRAMSSLIKIPPNVFQSAISEKDNDELRRLLYVALTRAKKELYVSYHNQDLKEKETEKSDFLYEAFGSSIEPTSPEISNEDILTFETLINTVDEKVKLEKLEKTYVEKQLQNFELNVTALNNFLSCPLHFYYNNILRIPSGIAENMSFGSGIHEALEKLFSDMKNNNQVFPSEEQFQNYFIFWIQKNKEKFSTEGYQTKMKYGLELLSIIYKTNIDSWHKIVNVEFKTKAVLNGIPLKGFIDKVEYYDNEIVLIDYKTGDKDSAYTKEKLKTKEQDSKDIGGDYWRQAMFYKILLDNDVTNKYHVKYAQYDFLEPGKKTKELPKPQIFEFRNEEIEQVKEQITDTWQKIQNHEFYEGCGDEKCTWCSFAKTLEK